MKKIDFRQRAAKTEERKRKSKNQTDRGDVPRFWNE